MLIIEEQRHQSVIFVEYNIQFNSIGLHLEVSGSVAHVTFPVDMVNALSTKTLFL